MSSLIKTSLTPNTAYILARDNEMLYNLSSLFYLKIKHTVKETCRPHSTFEEGVGVSSWDLTSFCGTPAWHQGQGGAGTRHHFWLLYCTACLEVCTVLLVFIYIYLINLRFLSLLV
jgi:hypothetical protein